jgi:YD repeat-containing protein
MNYDGHGRMSFRKRPEEGASGTVYTYYKDDLLQTTTDARGASATLSYNARHLTTNIAYSSPNESAVPNAPSVSFQYDENGNRTVMNDGVGTVTYGYNTLGLLTSETRQFSELVNNHFVHYGTGQPIQTSYQIGYSYNLGRQLQSITTPTGDTIDYTRDKAGRITRVSGTPRDGVADYVTEVAYRAWGAEKRYAFGHQNYSITMSHNARMQVSRIDDQDKLAADYTYTADGRLSGVQALNDRRLDRSFSFDHAGRVTGTRSASEAGLGSGEPAQLRQDYGYDEFGHMTLRQGRYWYTQNNTFSATYANNIASNVMDGGQAQNWQYDAEGNVTSEGGKTHAFDAVGRRVKSTSTDTFYYDGDGRLISQTYIDPPPSTNPTGSKSTYYLWSTVLKENLAQIRLDGDASNDPGDEKTYHRDVFIYVNGQQVAVRKYDQGVSGSQPNLNSLVEWNHRDPLDTMARSVDSAGGSTYSVDPLGVLAVAAFQNEINNFWSPPSGSPGPPPQGFYQYSSANFSRTGISSPNAGSWGLGCSIDGIQSSCETAFRLISNGSVWGVTLISRGGEQTPEARNVATTIKGSAASMRVRYENRTIPGTGPGTGLKFEAFPYADIPASQDELGDTYRVAVYEYVGAISGDLVFGGGGQDFPLPISRQQIDSVIREGEAKRHPTTQSTTPEPPVTSNCLPWESGGKAAYEFLAKEALGTNFIEFPTVMGNQKWRIVPKAGLTEADTQKAFMKVGWQHQLNGNPEHFGGSDFEKYYQGAWFHVTIAHARYPKKAGGDFVIASVLGPPPWITIHCELNYRPSSTEHFWDNIKRNYPIIWFLMTNQ